MTPLMNTVANNNTAGFIYLYFAKNCSLDTVDVNGNTLLHLAAKSNAVGIAKILRHLHKAGKEGVFDLNRTNIAGESPAFQTVQVLSVQMLKMLMESGCKVTLKESRGDTLGEHVLRHSAKNPIMVAAYMKFEDKMVIKGILNQATHLKAFFRWTSPRFVGLFVKMAYEKWAKDYHSIVLQGVLGISLILHWIFYQGTTGLAVFFHLSLAGVAISLKTFQPANGIRQ